jgi:cysteinyl-tRNA synthetase
LTTDVNTLLNSSQAIGRQTLEAINQLYQDFGGTVLGVIPEQFIQESNMEVMEGLVRMLIDLRNEARATKDFKRSDQIRDRLTELGVVLEDGKSGTTWRLNK